MSLVCFRHHLTNMRGTYLTNKSILFVSIFLIKIPMSNTTIWYYKIQLQGRKCIRCQLSALHFVIRGLKFYTANVEQLKEFHFIQFHTDTTRTILLYILKLFSFTESTYCSWSSIKHIWVYWNSIVFPFKIVFD